MKKQYSRKQIQEALTWWRAQLKRLDESKELDDFDTQVQSDELAGSEEEGKKEDEEDGEPDYSEYEAAVKRHQEKQEESLEAERKQLGLGPDEVVCLLMGALCIYNGKTHETRGLTKEQYDKYCELSKKWNADWEENVGKHWPKKKDKKIKESLDKGNTMNKKYTKKQITEAIAYWEKQLRAGNYRIVSESKDATRIEKALLKAAKENSWNDAVDFASHLAEVFNSDEYPHDLDKKQRIKELIEYFGNSKKCSYSTVVDIVQKATDHAAEDAVDDQISMISRYVNSAKLLVACFQDYESIDSLVVKLINDALDEINSMYKKLYDGFYYDISLDEALELCSRIDYELDYVVDFKIFNSISDEDKKREVRAAIDKANQAYSELKKEFPDIDELRGY